MFYFNFYYTFLLTAQRVMLCHRKRYMLFYTIWVFFKTRDSFPAAKIRKEGSQKLLTVETKSRFSNFYVGWRRSPIHENICWWFLNRHKHLTGASKLRNCVFLGKCLKWNLSFQNWSKSLCLCVSGPTKRLTAQSTAAYALRNWQGKQEFVKENKKKRKKEKKICTFLEIYGWIFFPKWPFNNWKLPAVYNCKV